MMKNVFHFTLKALFILKIFKFLTFFVLYKNRLIRKIRLILEFMTSQPGQQTIIIHILPNISRSKGSQTMKFGHLIEHNMRNIFVEKSYPKRAGESIPRPLSKISKLSISLDELCKVLNSLFLLYASLRAIEIYSEIKLQTTCFYVI